MFCLRLCQSRRDDRMEPRASARGPARHTLPVPEGRVMLFTNGCRETITRPSATGEDGHPRVPALCVGLHSVVPTGLWPGRAWWIVLLSLPGNKGAAEHQ